MTTGQYLPAYPLDEPEYDPFRDLPATCEDAVEEDGVLYIAADGLPLGESELHQREIIRVLQALTHAFAGDPSIHVAADRFVFWQRGVPSASVAPDIFVAKGVEPKPPRKVFQLWHENAGPAVVIEVASYWTWRNDLGRKRQTYEMLGVHEYFVFDPEAIYIRPPLQGWRLHAGRYAPMDADDEGGFVSEELGMRLMIVDGSLLLFDARTGTPVLGAEERAALAYERAAAAEARVAELEALLAERQERDE